MKEWLSFKNEKYVKRYMNERLKREKKKRDIRGGEVRLCTTGWVRTVPASAPGPSHHIQASTLYLSTVQYHIYCIMLYIKPRFVGFYTL